MRVVLAYAESADSSNAMNLAKVLGGLLIIGASALLACLVIAIARRRAHRQADAIMVAMIFWAVLTAGSAMYAGVAHLNWSKEYNARIESGYFDPHDVSDAPKTPWVFFLGLGAAYLGLLVWSFAQKQEGVRQE